MIKYLASRFKGSIPLSTGPTWHFQGPTLPNERDYSHLVGDGSGSNLVGPGIDYIADAFVEAPIRVRKREGGVLSEPVYDHPMVARMRRPNPFYSGALLWMATISNWITDGNAYWLPLHWTEAGEPMDFYFIPSVFIEPKRPDNGSTFISHYEYKPGSGPAIKLAPDKLVHFRWGLDPKNPLKGYSRLKRVLREIYSDEEAARFTAAILHNLGVPGLLIYPKGEVGMSVKEAQDTKREIIQKTTGDRRGEPLVMTSETGLETYGFSPTELNLSNLRAIPESRVAAALGIPAAVLGFLAGMTQTKVGATMIELREQAYESGVAPKQRLMAEELATQVLPYWTDFPEDFEVDFDLSQVRVLQEDQSKLVTRVNTMVTGGWCTVKRAKMLVGEQPDEEDDVYLRSNNVTAVDPTDQMPEPVPDPLQQQPDQPPPTPLRVVNRIEYDEVTGQMTKTWKELEEVPNA